MVQDGIALLLAESNAYLDDYTNNSHLLILVAFKVAKKATKTYASTKLKAEEGVVQDEITLLLAKSNSPHLQEVPNMIQGKYRVYCTQSYNNQYTI